MVDEEGIDELIGKLMPVGSEEATDTSDLPGFLDENLIYFLSKCNAGYSHDNYFHFFGTNGNEGHDLRKWNSEGLWKKEYGELVEDYYFLPKIFLEINLARRLEARVTRSLCSGLTTDESKRSQMISWNLSNSRFLILISLPRCENLVWSFCDPPLEHSLRFTIYPTGNRYCWGEIPAM